MTERISNKLFLIAVGILSLFSLGLIILHANKEPLTIWGYFSVWFLLFLLSLWTFFLSLSQNQRESFFSSLKENWKIIGAIVLFSGALRFFLLGELPYISIHDEMRDCGGYALEFFNQTPRDPFDFGFASGFGNFPPFISALFYPLTGASFLLYRIPCALFGVLVCVLTYFLGTHCYGRRVGIISALCISSMPLHIHFSRVELVVLSDSLMGILLLFSTFLAIQRTQGFFVLGLVYGLCIHFYSASRAAMVATAVFLGFIVCRRIIIGLKDKSFVKTFSNEFTLPFIYTCLGMFIALGPTINYLSYENLFSPGVPDYFFKKEELSISGLPALFEKALWIYLKSLSTIVYEQFLPYDKYPSQQPIFSLPLNVFFIIGVTQCLRSAKKYQGALILFFILFIPLLVQVLPNRPHQSYRILTMIPALNILAALGISVFSEIIFKKYKNNFIIVLLTIVTINNIYGFFIIRPSDNWPKEKPMEQPFQAMLEHIKENIPAEQKVVIYMSKNHDAPHHHEKVDFMLFQRNYEMLDKDKFIEALKVNVDRNKVFFGTEQISDDSTIQSKPYVLDCSKLNYFQALSCPPRYDGQIVFFSYSLTQ